jgi:hypothetical protein
MDIKLPFIDGFKLTHCEGKNTCTIYLELTHNQQSAICTTLASAMGTLTSRGHQLVTLELYPTHN